MDSIIKNANILIVDDNQANIDVLESFLEIQGYTNFKSITDSRLVFDLFESFKPDLILLDLMMPNLNGYEVIRQLKTLIPQNTYLPVLVLTADITTEAKQRALALGAKDFLSKPFDLTEVGLRIKNLIETRFLHQQLNSQNQILEEKVKDRTIELENTIFDLEIAKRKAEDSDRLKTAFMNNISHEIRTPLNGILGFGSLIVQPDLEAEEKEEYLESLNISSYRLMNTITDYMDISLIVTDNLEVNHKPVVISAMMTKVFQYFQESCVKKNIELKMQLPADADNFILNTDGIILQKAISKLVDNAVKFTSEGSVMLGFQFNNNEIEIFVKDTGKGIGRSAQDRIFEFFTQEDISNTRGHEGSGLGLSIAKGIIQLLGGKISLKSEKNIGTTVFITLPYNKATTSIKPTNSLKAPKERKAPLILIAEDDNYNYFFIETLLKKESKTLRAFNGQEAVDLCKMHPDIDLILMDIRMPVMNGLEATHIIKTFRHDLPIIAVTAYAQSNDELKIRKAGCDDYISKPIKKAELLSLVQKHFN
jgi:two-component system, sensor histidine kinase and response regulator